MYNTKKVCTKCGWSTTYDSNRDIFGKGVGNYCPKCGSKTIKKPYSPNL